MSTITYKRPFNGVLVAGDNTLYTVAGGSAQIRAITAHNPTASPVELTIAIGGKRYIKRSLVADSTTTIPELINQQAEASETIIATGTGLNIMLSLAEII